MIHKQVKKERQDHGRTGSQTAGNRTKENQTEEIMEADFAPYINALRFILGIPAVAIPIYFYIRGLNQKNQLVVQQDRLKKEFERKYVCPNPKCKRFFGFTPYDEIRYLNACPRCRCKYHE